MTNLTIFVNADSQDLEQGTSAVDWIQLDIASDRLIFSNGSDAVKDGEVIPSDSEYSQAGSIVSDTVDVQVAKCFLEDTSAGLLKEIHNYSANKRYVFAFVFDGATASEPVLELWDNEDLNSRSLTSLGAGVANDSWWKGITTTDGLPGADWVGSKLAGNVAGHFLYLNNQNGALSVAKTLYCNLKLVIPAGIAVSGCDQPLLVCKFVGN